MRRKTVVTLTREKGKKERCEKKNCSDFKNEKEVKKK